MNHCFFVALLLPWFLGTVALAEPLSTEQTQFFEGKIRPLLIERCYGCHSTAQKVKGGLRLDSRSGWQTGGDTGPAAVPGNPDGSLLIRAVRYSDSDLQMPPEGKLADDEIKLLEEWVRQGVPDPRIDVSESSGNAAAKIDGLQHWAYQPLRHGNQPNTQDNVWPLSRVDEFILAKLETQSLHPAVDAADGQWLRRVSFDLIGLPPSVEELRDFEADHSEDRFGRVVDRLLASPAFGPRWARPWLDVMGYADQIGSANDVPAEHAWRYRDYVVDSMNADLPFDTFLRQQLAGDLLEAHSIEERQRQITATGFLILGNVNIVEGDKLIMRMDLVDQQIEKVGKVFLGMTLNCVRCHDHKFDPITLKDYYGLAGIFSSTDSTYRSDRGGWSGVTKRELPETLDQFNSREADFRRHEAKIEEFNKEVAATSSRIQELDRLIQQKKNGPAEQTGSATSVEELEKERNQLAGKQGQFEQRRWHLEYMRPTVPVVFAVKDANSIEDAKVQVRGNPHTTGASVPRGFVQIASHGPIPAVSGQQSGRRELAEWLSTAARPLVSRVTVNRIWAKMFGTGLVASVDYFGVRSDQPSHPELLDNLAADFLLKSWSTKSVIRTLATSHTYRQGSLATDSVQMVQSIDPENRLLWHMKPRRLDAEMLRDSVLKVSGLLDDKLGGPALSPQFAENVGGLNPKDVNPISFSLRRFRDDQYRLRTINLPVVRSSDQRGPAEILSFFDFPQPAQFTGQRPTTSVASQSLFLLNGPLLKEASRNLATELIANPQLTTDPERVNSVYQRVLGREPDQDEFQAAIQLAVGLPNSGGTAAGTTNVDSVGQWQQLIQALMASNEFLFRL